jgi:hypothetical protein
MKMLWHCHVTGHHELVLLSGFLQDSQEQIAALRGVQKRKSVPAGRGYKMPVSPWP